MAKHHPAHDYEREVMLEMERDWLKDAIIDRDRELWAVWRAMPPGPLKRRIAEILSWTEGVPKDWHLETIFFPEDDFD